MLGFAQGAGLTLVSNWVDVDMYEPRRRPFTLMLAIACCGLMSCGLPGGAATAGAQERSRDATRVAVTEDLRPTKTDDAPAAQKAPRKRDEAGYAGGSRTAARNPSSKSEQSIVALVNDEPITGYEVRQRTEMLSGGAVAEYVKKNAQDRWKRVMSSSGIQDEFKAFASKRNPRTKEELQALQKQFVAAKRDAMMAQLQSEARSKTGGKANKEALDELIDEKLKLQEAKRVGATVDETEIDRVIQSIAERNKLSMEQLKQSLGGSLEPMRLRIRSTLSWNDVIRRKFGQQISIASRDVDKYISSAGAGEDSVELQVQRVRIALPGKLDQAGVAERVSQAEEIRGKFTDCKSTAKVVAGIAGARVDDLGRRRAAAFPEPTRSLLLSAQDNEMLPPAVSEDGVDLYAVCSRDVVKAEETQRSQAEGELKQKEFELLSKRHLKDLRQDAHIEYR